MIDLFQIDTGSSLLLPFADEGIRAGFPSPAQDYMDIAIDLNLELITHPYSTFYGRVKGNSMEDAHVFDGDILVIDKSLEARDGDMAVCFLDGEFTLKTIRIKSEEILLEPANPDYPTIHVSADNDFVIWGIVTYCIHKIRR